MESYQPRKKIGMLHPRYKKVKCKRCTKKDNRKDVTVSKAMIKFENGSEIHSVDCDDSTRGKRANDMWMNQEIQCYSCSNKDICRYHGDYLEQVVHIIDVYDGVFDLTCNHYKSMEVLKTKKTVHDLGINSDEWNRDFDLLNRIRNGENLTKSDLK